jgi:type I restriction enzyme S subunit
MEESETITSNENSFFPGQEELPKLPNGWCWKRFDCVCERVSVGHVGPTTEFFCTNGSGIPLIRSQDVRPGRLMLQNAAHITAEFHAKLRKSQLKPGDVLIVRVGANRGDSCVVPRGVSSLNCANIVFARPYEPNGFFGFFFRSPLGRNLLLSATTGAAQGVINTHSVAAMPVPVPPLPIQRRIAGILLTYDDLIDNNQRRIEILEEMAGLLYREWFVNFRFPGHEKVSFVDSPLGPIPKGWRGQFGDLVNIERDGINPSDFVGEQFEHFSIPAFDSGRQAIVELGETILSGKYCIDDSSVLLSKLNPRIPRIWLPVPSGEHRAITSTEFLVLNPKPGVTREFIYGKCSSEEFAGQFGSFAIGTSTSHQRVKPENLLAMPSIVPGPTTIERFTKLVSPMLAMSQRLRVKIQNLRRTRDLLLPRLLSGEIQVSNKKNTVNNEHRDTERTARA